MRKRSVYRLPPALVDDLTRQNPWWQSDPQPVLPAFRRWPYAVLDKRLRDPIAPIVLLRGPRQVGKTTLLRQLADDLLDSGWPPANLTYFDFEDFRLKRQVSPEEIAKLRPADADRDRPQILLLDELHNVPRWDRWLKHAVDNRLGRIVATDSAASLLREAGRESGLGRWDEIVLEGLTAQEFAALTTGPAGAQRGSARSARDDLRGLAGDPELVERYLAVGGFPAHATSDDYRLVRERLRNDIVDRALRRDLAARVQDPERLRKLFVYLVQESGAEQNLAARANDLGNVDARTVAKWVGLLEDTFLVVTLDRGSSSNKAAERLRGRSKLYAGDHGLVTAFAEVPAHESEVRGKVFETVVYRHLREIARAQSGRVQYLRWKDGLEVDFILEAGSERFAVEVTHSVQPKPGKRKTLERAAERAGIGRAVLIHGGLAEGEVEGITFLPLFRFLADPWPALAGDRPGGGR